MHTQTTAPRSESCLSLVETPSREEVIPPGLPRPPGEIQHLITTAAWVDDPATQMRVLCWLVWLGWTRDGIVHVLTSRSAPWSDPAARGRQADRLWSSVSAAYNKVVFGSYKAPPGSPERRRASFRLEMPRDPKDVPRLSDESARSYVDEIRDTIRAHIWRGQAGRTDRTVLEAMLDIAKEFGTEAPICSARDVARGANVTPKTAGIAMKRLTEGIAWVRCLDRQGSKADRWTGNAFRYLLLNPLLPGPEGRCSFTTYSLLVLDDRNENVCGSPATADVPHVSHPAFAPGALGKASHDLLVALSPDSSFQTQRAWADAAGVSPSTVSRRLKDFRHLGLVSDGPGGWVRLAGAQLLMVLDFAGLVLGGVSRQRRKATQTEQDRIRFAQDRLRYLGREAGAPYRDLTPVNSRVAYDEVNDKEVLLTDLEQDATKAVAPHGEPGSYVVAVASGAMAQVVTGPVPEQDALDLIDGAVVDLNGAPLPHRVAT